MRIARRHGGRDRKPRLSMLGNRTALFDTRSAKPAPKRADPFYLSAEWRALVADIIRERGARCEDSCCHYPGRTGVRVFGDHIVELKDGGAPLDKTNVMLRCGSCHTRKTNAERARRMRS
jgi:5-methylcytosine-specific restriction enzyme A